MAALPKESDDVQFQWNDGSYSCKRTIVDIIVIGRDWNFVTPSVYFANGIIRLPLRARKIDLREVNNYKSIQAFNGTDTVYKYSLINVGIMELSLILYSKNDSKLDSTKLDNFVKSAISVVRKYIHITQVDRELYIHRSNLEQFGRVISTALNVAETRRKFKLPKSLAFCFLGDYHGGVQVSSKQALKVLTEFIKNEMALEICLNVVYEWTLPDSALFFKGQEIKARVGDDIKFSEYFPLALTGIGKYCVNFLTDTEHDSEIKVTQATFSSDIFKNINVNKPVPCEASVMGNLVANFWSDIGQNGYKIMKQDYLFKADFHLEDLELIKRIINRWEERWNGVACVELVLSMQDKKKDISQCLIASEQFLHSRNLTTDVLKKMDKKTVIERAKFYIERSVNTIKPHLINLRKTIEDMEKKVNGFKERYMCTKGEFLNILASEAILSFFVHGIATGKHGEDWHDHSICTDLGLVAEKFNNGEFDAIQLHGNGVLETENNGWKYTPTIDPEPIFTKYNFLSNVE